MKLIRIEKFISNNLGISRNEIKRLIKQQKIKVNNQIINKIIHITDKDKITINDEIIQDFSRVYIMLNKPKGYICANHDKYHKTVFDLLEHKYQNIKNLHTIGRLDKDTEGILILTNDGELTHNLVSSKKHIPKTYYVKVDKKLNDDLIFQFKKGVNINEKKLTKSSELKILNDFEAELIISEGKFHQIKRMFQAFNYKVIELKRIKFNNLKLPNSLKLGSYLVIKKEDLTK
ncbi:pseudouridine synthase [Mycoplasmopsis cynos]|uniref:Pseudouridine synthase n=1 Tax=Mycoplasmopsis cynos TaxID=171284 RepID=A0A449AJ82_9BACT|nr:pseudouridine synthase [Mycoplasmopsis cynos]VEU65037.1 Pseudouridine synthase [Mycoplasmopsis cynos]